MTELQMLLHEKKEIERKIKFLTSGAITNDLVKLDRINFASQYQKGKWAVFYKYHHIVSAGREGRAEIRDRWSPLFNADSREEAVNMLPVAIKALTELYEMAKGEQHGTDT